MTWKMLSWIIKETRIWLSIYVIGELFSFVFRIAILKSSNPIWYCTWIEQNTSSCAYKKLACFKIDLIRSLLKKNFICVAIQTISGHNCVTVMVSRKAFADSFQNPFNTSIKPEITYNLLQIAPTKWLGKRHQFIFYRNFHFIVFLKSKKKVIDVYNHNLIKVV